MSAWSPTMSAAFLLAVLALLAAVMTAVTRRLARVARVLRVDRDIEETFDRAWRMLRMRRMLIASGEGFAVSPRNRALIGYYANSIAHLLGPFGHAVRQRDRLPAELIAGL